MTWLSTCRQLSSGARDGQQRSPSLMRKLAQSQAIHLLILCLLTAALLLILSGCSTIRSSSPTILRQPPSACLTQCPLLPELTSGEEAVRRQWEGQVLERAGECRRQHAECVEWNSKTNP